MNESQRAPRPKASARVEPGGAVLPENVDPQDMNINLVQLVQEFMDKYRGGDADMVKSLIDVGFLFRNFVPSPESTRSIVDLGLLEALCDLMRQDAPQLAGQAIWAMNEVIRSLDDAHEDDVVDRILDMGVTEIVFGAMMNVLDPTQQAAAISLVSYLSMISRAERDCVLGHTSPEKLNEWLSSPVDDVRIAAAELVKNLVYQKGVFSSGQNGEEFCKWIVTKFLGDYREDIGSGVYKMLLCAIGYLADESKGFAEFLHGTMFHGYITEALESSDKLDPETIGHLFYVLAGIARAKRDMEFDPDFLMRFATSDNENVSVRALRVIGILVELSENAVRFGRDDILEAMKGALVNTSYNVKMEVHEVLSTMVVDERGGSIAQKLAVMGFIPIFIDLLANFQEQEQQQAILRTLDYILRYGETSSTYNVVLEHFLECDAFANLESLLSDHVLGASASEQAEDILRRAQEYSASPSVGPSQVEDPPP